ncbi:hypothetical protein AB6F61_03120 [Providencia hangzhouensis]
MHITKQQLGWLLSGLTLGTYEKLHRPLHNLEV